MAQDGGTKPKPSGETRAKAVARMRERIAEDDRARQQGRSLGRYPRMEPFWIGFLATVVPIVALGVIAAAYRSWGAFWLFAAAVEVLGFFVAIVLSVLHVDGANGVWAGLGIGFVALGITCFAAAA